MKANAFIGKQSQPTPKDLASVLGPSYKLWEQLISDLQLEPEWKSYSVKAGWSLKLQQKKRTILYVGPCDKCFRATFVLGGKAIAAAKAADLPARVLKLIADGKKYPEGTALYFENVKARDLAAIKKLASIKIAS